MHRATAGDQAKAGFGVGFEWDVDLISGYECSFLTNVAAKPGLHHFNGVDVPGIGIELQRQRFDAVMVTGWHLKGYLQAIGAAKWARLPVIARGDSQIYTPRSVVKRAGKMLSYPLLLRVFDAALYVGKRSREYWLHYHYPERRLFFSPHCIDNDWFAAQAHISAGVLRRKLGILPEAKLVLFAGKLRAFKRPLDVIEACAALRRKGVDVQVMVAGSGELEGEIRRRSAEAAVPLYMLGFQNQSGMPAAYSAANVLVLPSTSSETWGLVVNEALASGTPVVVSDACGCSPDLASDGIAGATYPVGDIQALANRISDVVGRAGAKEHIASTIGQYSLGRAAAGIVACVQEVIK